MQDLDRMTSPVRSVIAALISASHWPLDLWQAFQEADEGVCLMAPARVKADRARGYDGR